MSGNPEEVVCPECKNPILPGTPIVNAGGKQLHPDCLICKGCGKSLTKDDKGKLLETMSMVMAEDAPYHKACAEEKLGAKCSVCNKSAMSYIEAGGKKFHQECFVCTKCKKVIDEPGYKEHEGQILHENCYWTCYVGMCDTCGKVLECGFVTVPQPDGKTEKKMHPNCFKCGICNEVITGRFAQAVGNTGPIHDTCANGALDKNPPEKK